ncbi:hypothetical protein DC522_23950 [Microvirga sp. KLBC 81]|uniref:DUF6894 family protein n=1 Tax=Microvirga sp. KLBC 81 TaxID=1862707 RepID=UPI000D515CF5|nr:hypothetical protein [Microvirga sp. KLBC 81]PVE21920.1 hypothetical protein DC522_23950 [Microvirga sp. KLBC 81]
MPRYYFNLYQGSQLISQDDTGYECPNNAAARQFAQLSNGLVALDPFLSGASVRCCIVVLNEARQSIFTLPISK